MQNVSEAERSLLRLLSVIYAPTTITGILPSLQLYGCAGPNEPWTGDLAD